MATGGAQCNPWVGNAMLHHVALEGRGQRACALSNEMYGRTLCPRSYMPPGRFSLNCAPLRSRLNCHGPYHNQRENRALPNNSFWVSLHGSKSQFVRHH